MYQLDTASARKADAIGAYLSETGKYTGVFTRAEKLVSQGKDTHGIGFAFKADDGRETRFDIWTKKGTGEPLSGMNQINALMTCLQLRQLTETPQQVKKWDTNQKAEVVMSAPCFVELMNKPVGLLLRSEEYEKMQNGQKTGETGWRMNLFACFQAGTELMASEILDRKTKPEQLAKAVAVLADRPLKKDGAPQRAASQQNSAPQFDDMDDSIPF